MATIYTDRQMILDSLKNGNIQTFLIEEIRSKLTEMGKTDRKIQFCWGKVHVGIEENWLADTIAKGAATKLGITECHKKIPKRVVISGISVEKWQREWE
jgi:ribonuclease HI